MSDKKKRGLDYTPQAFPGARAPDGPAPGLEESLADMGLLESAKARDEHAGKSASRVPERKKKGGLDYTPQAFPGARAPDGPAPDLEQRLAELGVTEHPASPAQSSIRSAESRTAKPPVSALHRESVLADASHRASAVPPSIIPKVAVPVPPKPDERAGTPLTPPAARTQSVPPPMATLPSPKPTNYVVPPQSYVSSLPAVPVVQAQQQAVPPTPPPPHTSAGPSREPLPKLPPVPKEAVPKPLPFTIAAPQIPTIAKETTSPPPPVVTTARASQPSKEPRSIGTQSRTAMRQAARLRRLEDKDERVRLSLRLMPTVDAKLDELASLRALDRNTAISVAIVQDWMACFGTPTKPPRS